MLPISCGHKKSDTTERLHFHFSLSCIGEGNGNPLQCSCLENPRDGGAWWATISGVAQSRTRLKRLSSSSSSSSSSNPLLCGAAPYFVGCLAASLDSLNSSSTCPSPRQVAKTKNVSRYYQMSPKGQNCPQLRSPRLFSPCPLCNRLL